MQRITPFLWFDTEGEVAARLYISLFKNSRILRTTHYGEAGPRPKGTVMTVEFELEGQRFVALNGGPEFTFTEAISFEVECDGQEEVDRLWNALIADGGQPSQCGWLKDKFGLSWQIIPKILNKLLTDPDPARARRAMQAMLQMKKIDVATLQKAADGN